MFEEVKPAMTPTGEVVRVAGQVSKQQPCARGGGVNQVDKQAGEMGVSL